jgi:hypothetical protein
MYVTKKTVWKIHILDQHWLKRAVCELLSLPDVDCRDIELPTELHALEFGKQVLRKLAELTPVTQTLPRACSSDKLIERRYVGIPEVSVGDDADWRKIFLSRQVETRSGNSSNIVKTVFVDGETYTRNAVEICWGEWKSDAPEIVYLTVYPEKRIILG